MNGNTNLLSFPLRRNNLRAELVKCFQIENNQNVDSFATVFCKFVLLLRRECNLLTAVKGFKVDLEASRT